MSRLNPWTNEEIKELKKAVKKAETVSQGIKVFAETSNRSEGAIGVKWYSMNSKKSAVKRKYTKRAKAESTAERISVSKGLTFDIQNIKRATLNGNNTLTLFF